MGAMAQADVGHGVNAAFPEGKIIQGHEIRCVATTANGTCGALLRDKDGHQARDDVFFARKACVHGLCGACLVGQVLKCTSEGKVYKCPVCGHSWTSWDVRSRREDVVASAAGGSKKRKTETFQATKQTWGQDPKRGIFAPKSVREFHAEHANSSGAGGSAGESLGACAIAVSAVGQDNRVQTWDCKLPVRAGDSEGDKRVRATLEQLGRNLRQTIVREKFEAGEIVSGAGDGTGVVGYEDIIAIARRDNSRLGDFTRSLCAGEARMPSVDELKNNKHAFKEVMGAWAASELILGVHSSAQVQRDNVTGVRPLRKFMAWGHAMMDSSAFAAATRSMGLSHTPPLRFLVSRRYCNQHHHLPGRNSNKLHHHPAFRVTSRVPRPRRWP